MQTDAQRKANKAWKRRNVTQRLMSFYPSTAAELAWYDSQPNKNAYIIGLIRDDMKRRGGV